MFKASKIMTTDVVTVSPDTTVLDAIRLLVDKKISGLPVVDDSGTLVGIISEKDLLRLLYEVQAKNTPVSKFMTTNVVVFDENDELYDICECLIKNHFRRVPITSEGKLIGIISRPDIIEFILSLGQSK